MNLIINKISIIAPNSKKAKIQDFKKGINVITTRNNWMGKSSLIRSIYHSLGADALFDDKWEKEKEVIYLLDFNIDNDNYLILRKDKFFRLFNNKREEILNVINREELSQHLSTLFNFKIYLKNHIDKYTLASPSHYYSLNFMDQEKINPTTFESFKGLKAFKDFYEDLIYSHLGVYNNEYNNLREQEGKYKEEEKNLKEKIDLYYKINQELNLINLPIDMNAIGNLFKINKDRYSNIISKINKCTYKINKCYQMQLEFQNLLSEIENMVRGDKKNINNELKTHKCSRCDSKINNKQLHYFKNINFLENYSLQEINLKEELLKLEREIKNEKVKYSEYLKEIKEIEYTINSYNKEIEYIGLKKYLEEILIKIGDFKLREQNIKENIKNIKQNIKKMDNKKEKINIYYKNNFNEIKTKYSLTNIDENDYEKVTKKIKASGTYNNIFAVAWISALIKTKYEYSPETIRYPLILDTPNNADFSDKNTSTIFNIIFDNIKYSEQIITSLIDFEKHKFNIDTKSINLINLEGKERELLNKEDFEKAKLEFSFLNLF